MLTIGEFKEKEAAGRLSDPGLFRLASPDPPASVEQIYLVEAALGCRLSNAYREFLLASGGGDYPRFGVFSANPDSVFYLATRLAMLRSLVPANLLPFHDDHAGGLYVLKVDGGMASDPVYYWDWETRELSEMKYESVLDAIADLAFG